MYLKSLTLKGFKSFADRSHMVFEPGLTVIVGPNGSGKSNICDAILWVLGEQSAKQLRGQAMEDVVFAGSGARKPVGVAEVDMVLSNSDHTIPVDFDEIAVTRRMYRSGECEYLINGAPARLMDITDILHDSGLGKDTHSIISQGKLDAILASKPEERRALIEEAAGISKHKKRRERAERKLESMDEHLRRALDIQKEVNRQLRPLERQVDKARRWNQLNDRLEELRVVLAVDDLRMLKAQWEATESREKEAAAALELTEYQLKEGKRELAKLQGLLEQKGLFVGDLSAQRNRCQRIADKLTADIRLLDEKERNCTARLTSLLSEIGGLRERSSRCAVEAVAAQEAYDGDRAELAHLRERSKESDELVRQSQRARREADDALSDNAARQRQAQRQRDAAAVAVAKAQDALEGARVQDGLFTGRIEQLRVSIAQSEQLRDAAERAREELAARLEEAVGQETAARRAFQDAKDAYQEAQRAEARTRGDLTSAEVTLRGLQQAIAAEEDSAPIVSRVSGNKALAAAVRGRVADAFTVDAELAPLVENLLGFALTGFVVAGQEGMETVCKAAAGQSESASGQVQVLSDARMADVRTGLADSADATADTSDDGDLPGYRLIERLRIEPGFEEAVESLVGDVRVVGSVREACSMGLRDPRHRYVAPEGPVVVAGGSAVVGKAVEAATGLLERRRKALELEGRMPALREAAERSQEALAQADEARTQARAAQDAAAGAVARLRGEAGAKASEKAGIEQALARDAAALGRVEEERQKSARRSAETQEALASQKKALDDAERQLGELALGVGGLQAALDAARKDERSARDAQAATNLDLARVQERYRSSEARLARTEQESRSLEQRTAEAASSKEMLELFCARIAPLRRVLDDLLGEASARLATLNDRAVLAEADSTVLRQTIAEAREAVDRATARYNEALAAAGDIRVEKGRLDVRVTAAVEAISSRPGVVLEEALCLPAPQDRDADEREVAELEGLLGTMGPVNQVAFQEYESLKARADYLGEQVADLQHARADLTKILQAIDRKMRSSFLDTFQKVNQNFCDVFQTLFPGGSGHIEMTDPENPATTGIEVVAQPAGKRVAKMTLLSGGERSLTALGLLFAVYRTRTVPFYVLDEVEAALDDTNLDRLLDAIEVLRSKTQLIVISHQRRTMERADVLYGVSMQADGVSRVVSQKLEHR